MTSYSTFSYDEMQHWPHNDSKHLVIIAVPKEATLKNIDENENPIESKPLFTVEQNGQLGTKTVYRLPEEFIVGYVDVNKKELFLNPKYKSEHTYDGLYVKDSELATKDIDQDFFGEFSEEWLEEFAEVDNQISAEDRKKATEFIANNKSKEVVDMDKAAREASEEDYMNGW